MLVASNPCSVLCTHRVVRTRCHSCLSSHRHRPTAGRHCHRLLSHSADCAPHHRRVTTTTSNITTACLNNQTITAVFNSKHHHPSHGPVYILPAFTLLASCVVSPSPAATCPPHCTLLASPARWRHPNQFSLYNSAVVAQVALYTGAPGWAGQILTLHNNNNRCRPPPALTCPDPP